MFTYIPDQKYMLLGVYPRLYNNDEILKDLEEMESLVKTYGGKVYALSVQKGERPSQATYLRSGKLEEAVNLAEKEKIDVIIIKDNLKPGLIYTIQKIFSRINPNIQVWDKAFLILRIFAKHATSGESKLQIKVASLNHMGPRIYGMGYELSDQGGGIGNKGIGETNTEIMRRHWRNEIFQIKKKIKELESKRKLQIDRRKKIGVMTVSIIGYTNSGKSTLFNLLTGKRMLAENKLFATLDSVTGKLFLEGFAKPLLLTDTIGFIRNLPPRLVDAFKSTLMESVYSDIIILLIDSTDVDLRDKIYTVEKIAYELNFTRSKIIYVFNKIDNLDKEKKELLVKEYAENKPLFISAETGEGIEELKKAILTKINEV